MVKKYDFDRGWSDQHMRDAKDIIGPLLIEDSSFEVDTKKATDLVLFEAKPQMIACRLRRDGFHKRFPWDFTVRSARDSGAKTELSKIIEGWADLMFYGHIHENKRIMSWFLISLKAFREALIKDNRRDVKLSFQKKGNGDGTHFIAYDIRSFPSHICLASSHPIPFFGKSKDLALRGTA